MKNLIAVGFVAALAACGGGGSNNTKVTLIDAPGSNGSADATVAGCSVLTQAGCDAGQKCTWVQDQDPTSTDPGLGHNGCAPTGTAAIGAACTTQKVAMGGYDNCVGGAVCVSGTCKSICDNNGGTPACGTNQACVTYEGLFANVGATTTPAGVCDPSCNPLDDNDFDGSGTVHTKSGTACGASATVGCYGFPSTTHTTYFTCAPPAGGTGNLTHRSLVPMTSQYLNSCMSGYALSLFYDSDDGSMKIDCFAWCKPGDSYTGLPNGGAPNGVSPHRCNNTDALGNFAGGTPNGTAASNGEHCMFSWIGEVDNMGMFHRSPTSDTVGVCIDHTKYHYDSNGDGMITAADSVWPPCASLPKLSVTDAMGKITTYGADYFGCIASSEIPGMTFEKAKAFAADRIKRGMQMPEFPTLPMSQR